MQRLQVFAYLFFCCCCLGVVCWCLVCQSQAFALRLLGFVMLCVPAGPWVLKSAGI